MDSKERPGPSPGRTPGNDRAKQMVDKGQQTLKPQPKLKAFVTVPAGPATPAMPSDEDSKSRSELGPPPKDMYVDFDDLLPEIGEFGCFQKILFCLMIPFCFISAYVYLSQIFMTLQPHNYYCRVRELSMIESEQERKELSIPREKDGSFSRCRMYDVNYTAIFKAANRSGLINSSLPTIPCREGYVFSTKDTFETASMEFGWICDDELYATYAQMVFFAGSVLGCLGYGHFADHCGRLAALVSSCTLAFFGSLFTGLTTNFFGFAMTRLFVGAAYDTCFTMIYILVLEYVGPKYRTLVANMSLAVFYSPFTMAIPWIAITMGNWRSFALYGCIPIAFAFFSYCCLPESARWLVSRGKIDDAINILTRVAARNKRTVSKHYWDVFRESCEQFYQEEFEGRSFTVASIFKRKRLARYMVFMCLIWMIMSLVYDGHVRAASVLDKENVAIVFTIACATELPGDLLVVVTLDRCGRRWCAFIFTTLSGVFSLLGANLTHPTYTLVAALAGRFFANVCYNIGLQWAAEVLPTVVRAQGISLIHTLGFVAMLLSPPVIYLSHLSLSLMLNTLGGLGIVGGFLCLFLPETLHEDLPQTLSEGNNFGKDQRLWHQPCCGKHKRTATQQKDSWHAGSSLRSISRDEFRSRKLDRIAVKSRHNLWANQSSPEVEVVQRVQNLTVDQKHRSQ